MLWPHTKTRVVFDKHRKLRLQKTPIEIRNSEIENLLYLLKTTDNNTHTHYFLYICPG
jgi:hypothetical protein